jgi:VanZ family protein
MSSEHTSRFLRPLFERWFGPIRDSSWEFFHHALRKTGHFVGYGTVGFTFLRAWLHTLGRRGPMALLAWRLESTILAILSTAIVASGDEFHQTFLPSRTGNARRRAARHRGSRRTLPAGLAHLLEQANARSELEL